MRKLNYLIIVMMIATGLFMQSCEKDQAVEQQTGEISFGIENAISDLKGWGDDDYYVPECIEEDMSYVELRLGTEIITLDIIWLNNLPYTQALKLPVGTYTLNGFLVFDADGNLLMAAPEEESFYWDLMVNQLNKDIVIDAFKKQQVVIDVLCYEPLSYTSFGFSWFMLNEVVIERQCWFGDVCLEDDNFSSFYGSFYEQQEAGIIMMDMPLIMYIEVYKEDVLIRTFSNESFFAFNADGNGQYVDIDDEFEPHLTYDGYMGEGACLEVYWANDLGLIGENFTFKIYGLLEDGDGVEYQLINVFEFQDEKCPYPGEDGVNDFVVGSCSDGDWVFPCWSDLPETAFNMQVSEPSHGTFADLTLSGIPGDIGDYDIGNLTYGTWCSFLFGDIDEGYYTNVYAASSLLQLPPEVLVTGLTSTQVSQLNYFFNHLPNYYTGLNLGSPFPFNSFSEDETLDIQETMWYILGDIAYVNLTPFAKVMADDAINNGSAYVPPPGAYYSVIFYLDDVEGFQIQILPVPCN